MTLDRLKPAPDGAVNVKGRAIARCPGCGISATCEMMQRGASTTPPPAPAGGGVVEARLKMNYVRMKSKDGRSKMSRPSVAHKPHVPHTPAGTDLPAGPTCKTPCGGTGANGSSFPKSSSPNLKARTLSSGRIEMAAPRSRLGGRKPPLRSARSSRRRRRFRKCVPPGG